jgi:chemotaxis protein MotB
MKRVLFFAFSAILMTSCVSKKKLAEAQQSLAQLQASTDRAKQECETQNGALSRDNSSLRDQVKTRDNELASERAKSKSLQEQLDFLKKTNTNLLDRLSDLSIVSKTGAESIIKSLEALNDQSKYIQGLTSSMQRKDSLNMALVMNLKRSLSNVNDEDVTIEVKKGVVYVSLSDKMLFKFGSYDITPQAETVLGKIAQIVNDRKDLDILVEGHTDNVPYRSSFLEDNWDLSAKRATSVVRLLQKKYNVAPERMTAGGRSEFVPKAPNDSDQGRSMNRRTEIVILPKLDQFFQLLEAKR